MRDEAGQKLGLEMEMVVAHQRSGASHPVAGYFNALARIKRARGEQVRIMRLQGTPCGVLGPLGESGLDNGFNLLETAFAPVCGGSGGLARLAAVVTQELSDVLTGLAAEEATVLNASEHPACTLDPSWYARVRTPRPIYQELVGYRGWLHRVGIDAKAQNGPCTSIGIADATRALNVVLALAPASIALFANSPLQDGRPTGLQENRLVLWDRMFRYARFEGDYLLQRLPERPFEDLGDYFRWMFCPPTVSRALPLVPDKAYKSADTVVLLGDPALSRFLAAPSWPGRHYGSGERVTLRPASGHFEYSQFAHFLDARWRYRLRESPALDELLAAWRRPGGIEDLYARQGVDGYIEGRVCGAVFADAQLCDEAGREVASSAPLSPSALQLGLLRNLDAAEQLVRDWGWLRLRRLRAVAIRLAVHDDEIRALVQDTLAVARAGLAQEDHRWLGYADHVLQARRTGADRLLGLWNEVPGDAAQRLARLCVARQILV